MRSGQRHPALRGDTQTLGIGAGVGGGVGLGGLETLWNVCRLCFNRPTLLAIIAYTAVTFPYCVVN